MAMLAYVAAKASISAIVNQDVRHGRAVPAISVDENGHEVCAFDRLESSHGDYNTERRAIIRTDLERFAASRDERDREILNMLMQGMTEREIGEALKVSHVAVYKRIVKMREALRNAIA